MLQSIVNQIITERKKQKLSQRALAAKCGVPQSTIGRIESKSVEPSFAVLQKICQVLRLELSLQEADKTPAYLKRWNNLQFFCYWKNQPVSMVSVRGREVLVKKFIEHPVKQIFSQEKMDIFALSKLLQSRCWEEDRVGMSDILKRLGLTHYDPLAIVKKTHGVSYNDFLWFEFDNEHLRWEDVAPKRFRNV